MICYFYRPISKVIDWNQIMPVPFSSHTYCTISHLIIIQQRSTTTTKRRQQTHGHFCISWLAAVKYTNVICICTLSVESIGRTILVVICLLYVRLHCIEEKTYFVINSAPNQRIISIAKISGQI